MKKTSVFVDGRRKNTSGEYSVYVRLRDEQTKEVVKISSGLTSPVVFKGDSFPSSLPDAEFKNYVLSDLMCTIRKIMFTEGDELTVRELKEMALERLGKGGRVKVSRFVDYVNQYAETCRAPGTARLYRGTATKIESFDKKATFDTIDENWLVRFEKYCSRTMSVNGMGILFRNIRTVFNWARRNRYTTKYPFLNYSIRREETRKRNLDVDVIRQLRDIPCMTERIAEYRDMWMLMLYLIGINGKDLFTAKKSQLRNGRLEYRRAKTGKLYSIKVEAEAMAIIEKYRGKQYLLNVMERYETYEEYMRRMDRALKNIGRTWACPNLGYDKGSCPLCDGLSTYYSRHSWATLAAELDVTYEVISAALGHSIANPTTAIYINFNQKKVDQANRRVIDFVNADRVQ